MPVWQHGIPPCSAKNSEAKRLTQLFMSVFMECLKYLHSVNLVWIIINIDSTHLEVEITICSVNESMAWASILDSYKCKQSE